MFFPGSTDHLHSFISNTPPPQLASGDRSPELPKFCHQIVYYPISSYRADSLINPELKYLLDQVKKWVKLIDSQ